MRWLGRGLVVLVFAAWIVFCLAVLWPAFLAWEGR